MAFLHRLSAPPPLPDIHHGAVVPEPIRVESARLARGVRQLLVHWRGEPASSATWEDLEEFRVAYLDFQLEDELDLEGGEMSCGAAPMCVSVEPTTSGEPRPERPQQTQSARRKAGPRIVASLDFRRVIS